MAKKPNAKKVKKAASKSGKGGAVRLTPIGRPDIVAFSAFGYDKKGFPIARGVKDSVSVRGVKDTQGKR